jgi:integrase
MAKQTHRLTDAVIRRLTEAKLHPDGDGLHLKVTATGTKSWVFRFKHGAPHPFSMGLGPYPDTSLAKARAKAGDARTLLARGINPIEEKKRQAKAATPEQKQVMTFDLAVEQFLDDREGGWKNAKHRQQWRNTLKTYASPAIGKKEVADITTADVLQILKPIWQTKAETASRVRGRIESVLDWAKVNNFRTGENPAAWRGHLAHILPARNKKRTVRHHPALPFSEVPEFMDELRDNIAISSRALQFTVLTAVRTSEAINATWNEIDLDARLWIIPKQRMKADVEFRVPLADAAIAVLKALPRIDGNPYLFPGARNGRPLSNMAMLELLRGLRPGSTVHGFRSSFRDWAGDSTDFPRDTIEMCLAHAVEDEVEAAYRRSDMIAKRRRVMDAWASYCGRGVQKGEVIALANRR